jgi:nitrogen fixation protein
MPINEIWTNLRTFGYKGCQQFPLVKTRKNEGHSSEPTLHGGHEMALPQLPAVTQESYTIK